MSMSSHTILTTVLCVLGALTSVGAFMAAEEFKRNGKSDHPGAILHTVLGVVAALQALYCAYLLYSNETICSSGLKDRIMSRLNALRRRR